MRYPGLKAVGLKAALIGAGGVVLAVGGGVWVGSRLLTHGPRAASASVSTPSQVSLQPARVGAPATQPAAKLAAESPDELFAEHSPAVVRVIAHDSNFHVRLGSGFFVSKDGLLVTNYHVIGEADFASVVRGDNTTLYVEGIAAEDKDADLALLKVNVSNPPLLKIGPDAPPKVGTKVYAIGNSDGLTNTLSEGLISGLRTRANNIPTIQTSAAISHGSSGGPLMTADGVVVGVTSATVVDGQNLNFAVPASQIRQLMERKGEFQKLATAGAAPLDSSETQQFSAVWTALDKKQFSTASRLLAAMRDEQEKSPVYWLATGFLHNALNNPTLAIGAFKTALQLSPGSEPGWWGLGEAYRAAKRNSEAIEAFRSAAHLKPHDTRAYVGAGFAADAMGDDARAIEFFKKAREFSPDMPLLYAMTGLLYAHNKQPAQAIDFCQKSIKLKPDYAYGYVCLGIAYDSAGKSTEAVAAYLNAIRFDPFSADARLAKALLAKHK